MGIDQEREHETRAVVAISMLDTECKGIPQLI